MRSKPHPSYIPLNVVDGETGKLTVPHPYDNWNWWDDRGFKVKEHNLGSIEHYCSISFPSTIGDGLYKSLWFDFYKFEDGMEQRLTYLHYEKGLELELAWNIITRLAGAEKATN